MPMLFFQYGFVDVFPDDLGIDSSAAPSIALVMFALLVSIYVHSMLVVAVVMCSWSSLRCGVSHLFGTKTIQ